MDICTATFNEVNQHASSLTQWPQEYDQVTEGRFEGYLNDARIGPVRLFRERMNCGVAQHTHTPAGQYGLLIPLRLDPRKTSDQARCVLSEGITLLPFDQDFFFVAPPETDYTVIALDQAYMESTLSAEDLELLRSSRRSQGVSLTPQQLAIARSNMLSHLEEIEALTMETTGCSKGACPRSTASVECGIRDRLLLLALELYDQALEQGTPQPLGNYHHHIVNASHAYVTSEEGATASILQLCRELDIPRRSLNYSFEKVTGSSPTQYLRSVKLNAARRQLLTTELPITSVAANWGFFHLGYFGQEYRRLFGETPSATRANSGR
ncbi:helix-turn-helix domain-containing protein [Marinobacterium mangrovicola]|uniref:AraC family ethanolamine operon transcriptional activator n=1 Tax=Marinobacterium mangrovicola TaxID=1476959 RepID=A0A4R1GMS7_9GAMM|nr:helix-turn-helix domain-containing protein [Marinobacterium mangrovicola]TCK08561.1 AraC family ethanolamine operon transcriptional activator [Marinobacterium mangrovicola]